MAERRGQFAAAALMLLYLPVGENVVWSKGGLRVFFFGVKPDAISQ